MPGEGKKMFSLVLFFNNFSRLSTIKENPIFREYFHSFTLPFIPPEMRNNLQAVFLQENTIDDNREEVEHHPGLSTSIHLLLTM